VSVQLPKSDAQAEADGDVCGGKYANPRPSMFTDERINFQKFREGWCVPPRIWKSHYMVRYQLTDMATSLCGLVQRFIPIEDPSGFHSLWQEGTFSRCKNCERIKATYR
jgi:hypothetical protein